MIQTISEELLLWNSVCPVLTLNALVSITCKYVEETSRRFKVSPFPLEESKSKWSGRTGGLENDRFLFVWTNSINRIIILRHWPLGGVRNLFLNHHLYIGIVHCMRIWFSIMWDIYIYIFFKSQYFCRKKHQDLIWLWKVGYDALH